MVSNLFYHRQLIYSPKLASQEDGEAFSLARMVDIRVSVDWDVTWGILLGVDFGTA
jgi:hypothetical protein